jgi:acyl carrier protein
VRDAVVVTRQDTSDSPQLNAFVIADEGAPPLSAAALREGLSRELPGYLVPGSYRVLAAFPLTPNGKIDRRALAAGQVGERLIERRPDTESTALPQVAVGSVAPAESSGMSPRAQPAIDLFSGRHAERACYLGGRRAERPAYVAPRTATERTLALLWRGILELDDRVGMDDSFFALGGHSLHAAMLVSRIRNVFQVKLPLRQFFACSSLSALAATIDAARESGEVALPDQRGSP